MMRGTKRQIDAEVRRISSYAEYTETLLLDTIDVEFTVSEMAKMAKKFAWQTEKLSTLLVGDSTEETCENIWWFLRKYTTWLAEKGEQLRTPAMSLATGLADCDCTSLLTSTILLNLGIDHEFMVVAHNPDEPDMFTHVFVSVPVGRKKIFIDVVPEIAYFNAKEIKFYKQASYKMGARTVMLSGLSHNAQALKNSLEVEYLKLENLAKQAEQHGGMTNEGLAEMAVLKSVIATIGKDGFETALMNAMQRSAVASQAYTEIYNEYMSGGMSGLFDGIKKAFDKIGDSGIGKAFRNVRDTVVRPAIRESVPGGALIDSLASGIGKSIGSQNSQSSQDEYAYDNDFSEVVTPYNNVPAQSSANRTTTDNGGGSPDDEKPQGKFMAFVTKYKKWLIILVVVLVVAGVGTYFYRKNQKPKRRSLRGVRRKKTVSNAQVLAELQGLKRGRATPTKRRTTRRRKTTLAGARKYRIAVHKARPRKTKARRKPATRRKTTTRRKRAA